MDIKTVLLYGLINQLVYVQIPKGLETTANKEMVCKLFKTLYGLKQTSKLQYKRLSKFPLKKMGLKQINIDHSILVIPASINGGIVNPFVDNIKVMDMKRSGCIENIKRKLATAFEIMDMGPINLYLGLKVERNR